MRSPSATRGFTLIELLAALLILSLLALMSYRGLGAVLDAREHVELETEKWRRVSAFCARFGRDLQMAVPGPLRSRSTDSPAWIGANRAGAGSYLEFSRFASAEGLDAPRRVGYGLNEMQEIELQIWPGLDATPGAIPARHAVLRGVARFEILHLGAGLEWVDAWPLSPADPAIPRGVRLRIVLVSGEEIVRVYSLGA